MRWLLSIALCLLYLLPVRAQFRAVAPPPDTLLMVHLDNHEVVADPYFANDTQRYNYNQMRYYVTTVMPYVNAATALFIEINNTLATGISGRKKKEYIAMKESAMRDQFEERIKQLNTTQGKLLVKLIQRQTGLNIYSILQETKGTFPAIRYQTWARMNGLNLSRRYHPADEPDLERIMRNLGYPLRTDLAD